MSPSNPKKMRLALVLRASCLALALLGWAAAPAFAAPQVVAQDPEPGTEFHDDAPERVTITFSEPLDASSKIVVLDDCGGRVDDRDVTIGGTVDNELSIGIAKTVQSTYTIKYAATGVTGTATGSYAFVVHGGKPCDASGGGGHGGHGGSGTGGSGTGGGGTGGGSGGNGHGSGGHSSGGHGSGGGNNVDHSSMSDAEHAQMTDRQGAGHDMKNKGKHGTGKHGDGKHGDGKHAGKHRTGDKNGTGTDQAPLAAGSDTIPGDIPTGTTVVVSLGLAVALGMLGGWVLRVSSPS